MKAKKGTTFFACMALFFLENTLERYTQPLSDNHTLEVYNHDQLIFSENGHWLTPPLFAFERFLETYTRNKDCLSAHDTAAGKAAALLMARFGVKRAISI